MTDVFTNRGGLSEKSSDRAQRAVKAFRKLQPTLSSYARVLTGDPKVRVEMSTSNGMTDGKKIYYRPPLALGDARPHDRALCDKRDDHGLMRCPACAIREQVLIVIYHEIGHIAFGSFEETPENKEKYLREVLARMADEYDVARRAQHAKVYTSDAAQSYLGLAQYVSKFLPIVVNALDDSRVNNGVMEARKGTRVMFEADTHRVMAEGVEQVDPATGETIVVHHKDYPLNMQAAIGLYLKALGISTKGYLLPAVEDALADKKLNVIVNKMRTVRSMSATFEVGLEALFRLQQLGYFDPPEDMEQDEPDPEESEEQPEPDEEESEEESDDNGEGQGDDGDPGDSDEAPEESDEQGSEEGDPGDDSSVDDEERSSDGSADGGDDGEDSPDQDGTPGEADQEEVESEHDTSGDNSPDDSESDPSEGESSDGEGDDSDVREAEEDSTDGGSSGDQVGDEDSSVQDGEPDPGPESSDGEGEVDEQQETSESGDEADDGSESADSDEPEDMGDSSVGEDADSDPADGNEAGDSEGADGGTPQPRTGEDADASDESSGQDADEGTPEDGSESGLPADSASHADGDQSDDGSPGDEGDLDPEWESEEPVRDGPVASSGDGGTLASEEPPSSDEGGDVGAESDGDEFDPEPGVPEDDPVDYEPIDSGADEGRGGIETKDNSANDDLPMGDPEEVEKALHEFAHPEERPLFLEEEDNSGDKKEMDRAIIQGLYFETPSRNVHGVREHYYSSPQMVDGYNMSEGWPDLGQAYHGWYTEAGVLGDFDAPESVLGPALLRMRVAFADNKRGHEIRHRKAGKVDASVLGKRAHFNDSRLFKRRILPGKKDYFVLIGIDISGSTVGVNLQLSKRAALAQAELCARMGIRFAVYAHTGNYHSPRSGRAEGLDMEIYHVKDPDEPWSSAVQERLKKLGPSSVNLDGHTIEFYRKILDARPETHKVMLYYTDGKMPAENHDEELEILQREIKICRRKKHLLLGVGIRTDSPIRHGLDTVQVNDDEDIVKVVKHLERRLMEL